MEIFVWKSLEMFGDRLGKMASATRKFMSNRRANKTDRRHAVNDGIIVTLSTREEKRRNRDRRQYEVTLGMFVL